MLNHSYSMRTSMCLYVLLPIKFMAQMNGSKGTSSFCVSAYVTNDMIKASNFMDWVVECVKTSFLYIAFSASLTHSVLWSMCYLLHFWNLSESFAWHGKGIPYFQQYQLFRSSVEWCVNAMNAGYCILPLSIGVRTTWSRMGFYRWGFIHTTARRSLALFVKVHYFLWHFPSTSIFSTFFFFSSLPTDDAWQKANPVNH